MPAAAQRRAIAPDSQFFTRRACVLTISIIGSIGFVDSSVRRSEPPMPRRVKVSVSSSHSRSDAGRRGTETLIRDEAAPSVASLAPLRGLRALERLTLTYATTRDGDLWSLAELPRLTHPEVAQSLAEQAARLRSVRPDVQVVVGRGRA
jgi:hypothetical protein